MRRPKTSWNKFAKLLIQILALLHGGALVALPTFFQVFGLSLSDHRLAFWTVFTTIAIGLLTAVLAGLCAFFALANRADGNTKLLEAYHHRAWEHVSQSELNRLVAEGHSAGAQVAQNSAASSKKQAEDLEEEAKPFLASYGQWRTRGIGLVILSLLAFVAAAALGSYFTLPT